MAGISEMLAALLPGPVPQAVVRNFERDTGAPEGGVGKSIRRNEMYFNVRLNQMNLASNVKWFTVYDPLVVITVGFDYGASRIEIPSVLGPGLIQKHLAAGAPLFGTVLTDVNVTGPHPYRGRGITVSMSFYRVARKSYTKALLKVIERLSGMIGMDQIGTFASAGGALIDGVEGLLGGGETVCIAAHQFNLPQSAARPLQSGYSALIVPPLPANLETLAVRDGRLCETNERGEAAPFAGSDFVLMSIAGMDRRENEQFFPAYDLRKQAIKIIGEGKQSRKRAKALMLSALQQLGASNDFTQNEAKWLFDEWIGDFDERSDQFDRAHAMSHNGAEPGLPGMAVGLNDAMERLSL